MKQALKTIRETEAALKKIEEQTQKALDDAPEGSLRISCCGKKVKYFHVNPGNGKKQVYIPKSRLKLARELAQKNYDLKLLKLVSEKLRHLERFLAHYPAQDLDSVYNGLTKQSRELVTPVISTSDQYVRAWLEVPYEGLPFREDDTSVYYTEKGERVRSKSEVIIANALSRMDIPYRYECPLRLGTKTIYPDFTLLDITTRSKIYFEHFGMMDDEEYSRKALNKLNLYAGYGIVQGKGLIYTMESSGQPLDTRYLKTLLTAYFRDK